MKDIKVITAYYDGMEKGIRLFAHWKNGAQYVGTTGKLLTKALMEVEEQYQLALKRNEYEKTSINTV